MAHHIHIDPKDMKIHIVLDPVGGYVNEPVSQERMDKAEEAEFEIVEPLNHLPNETQQKID